jgi:hypothetical protein
MLRVLDLAALVGIVLTGIALGWFTPTEAASIGASCALLLCALRKRLTWDAFCEALAQTLRTSGMLYVVIIGALIFAAFMSFTGLAEQIEALVHGSTAADDDHHRHRDPAVAARVRARLAGAHVAHDADPSAHHHALGISPIWFGIFSCARWKSASCIRRSASTST